MCACVVCWVLSVCAISLYLFYIHTQCHHVFIVVTVKFCSVIRFRFYSCALFPFPSFFFLFDSLIIVTESATATHFSRFYIEFNTSGDNACINIDWALFTNLWTRFRAVFCCNTIAVNASSSRMESDSIIHSSVELTNIITTKSKYKNEKENNNEKSNNSNQQNTGCMMMIHIGNEISYKYTLPTTAFTMPVTFGYGNRSDSWAKCSLFFHVPFIYIYI